MKLDGDLLLKHERTSSFYVPDDVIRSIIVGTAPGTIVEYVAAYRVHCHADRSSELYFVRPIQLPHPMN